MTKKNRINKPLPEKHSLITPWSWLLVIAAITFAVYIPSLRNGFVNLDDDRYVYQNTKWIERPAEAIAAKPNGEVVKEMFSIPDGYHMGNYHPLTMVTYKIIHGFAGVDPFAYHLFNLLIHILNTLLAFFFIRRLTGKNELAAAAALLFGVHTLHVESVAWVSELKDLMYAFFFFASLICYLIYLDKQPAKRFLVFAVLLFLCSLLSKAMAASLSVVLILIDFYKGRKFTTQVLLEKIPFFALSLIFGIIAIKAQQSMEAIQDIALFKPYERVVFACYGFVTYLIKLVIPVNLSAYYAYPVKTDGALPGYYYLYPVAVIALVAATVYSLRHTKKVFFGIGFFAITVFLVLQLLPVGGAIMADRYAYIPSLGIFYLIADRFYAMYIQPQQRFIALGALTVLTILYSALTWDRCGIWKDGMTMWSDVIDKSQTIGKAYINRSSLYLDVARSQMDSSQFIPELRQKANTNLRNALADCDKVLALNRDNGFAWNNRGLALWGLGELDSAVVSFNSALKISPHNASTWSNLAAVMNDLNRPLDAIANYEKALLYAPEYADGWYNLGILKYYNNRKEEGCECLRKAADLGMEHAGNAVRDLCK